MENLISLVNKIQRACTALGDHGEASALPTLWDSLPAIAVVGGQVVFFIIISSVIFYIHFSFDLISDFAFFFYYFGSDGVVLALFVICTEFWKVISVGEYCWQGLFTAWIWYIQL